MTEQQLMTLTAYAARRGVSVKAVSKAVAAGRLVESVTRTAQGPRIADPELADREWAQNTRALTGPRKGPREYPVEGPIEVPVVPVARGPSREGPSAEPGIRTSQALRAAAAARRETALADMAEMELAERRGRLVSADEARAGVIQAYSLVKTKLLGVPAALGQRAPHLAAAAPFVDELIREALEELAEGEAQR